MAPVEKHQFEGLVASLELGIKTALDRFKKL
jgi:hypothetical protein